MMRSALLAGQKGRGRRVYQYRARIKGIVDGDTIDVSVDLGFCIYFRQHFRLASYSAPELKGPEKALGLLAKKKLEELLPLESEIAFESKKQDKYGRWLAEIVWQDSTLAAYLIGLGYGLPWDGQSERPRFDPQAPYPFTPNKQSA